VMLRNMLYPCTPVSHISAAPPVLICDVCCNPTAHIMNGHFVRLNCCSKELSRSVSSLSGLGRSRSAGNKGTRNIKTSMLLGN
jgi:hypothetical protein